MTQYLSICKVNTVMIVPRPWSGIVTGLHCRTLIGKSRAFDKNTLSCI